MAAVVMAAPLGTPSRLMSSALPSAPTTSPRGFLAVEDTRPKGQRGSGGGLCHITAPPPSIVVRDEHLSQDTAARRALRTPVAREED
jgi:hypothetical protein